MSRLVVMLVAASLWSWAAWAQPADRPLRIVVPNPPGGTADIIARFLVDGVGSVLGQRPVVESRTGAGGIVGAESVVRGPTDGSAVLLCAMGLMTISPELPGLKIPFDVKQDLLAVANVARSSYVVVTSETGPYKTLPELIAAAKARPGGLTYASAGTGSAQNLAGERLKALAGIDMVHVPYRGGAPAAADVAAGRVDLFITNLADVAGLIKGGQLRLLAMADGAGWPEFPKAPRLPDIVPGLEISGWFGICGPRGMPQEAIGRWAEAIRKTLDDPALRARMIELGLTPYFEDPAAFARTMASNRQMWGEAIRVAKIRAD